jgi:hypothetical protein
LLVYQKWLCGRNFWLTENGYLAGIHRSTQNIFTENALLTESIRLAWLQPDQAIVHHLSGHILCTHGIFYILLSVKQINGHYKIMFDFYVGSAWFRKFKLLINCKKKNQPDWIRFQTSKESSKISPSLIWKFEFLVLVSFDFFSKEKVFTTIKSQRKWKMKKKINANLDQKFRLRSEINNI